MKPGNLIPAIHQGPAPHRPRSKAPGQGSSASRRRFSRAPRSTIHSSGASTTRRRAPQPPPIIGGPRKAPRPSISGALTARGAKGKARPAAQAVPRRGRTPTAGLSPAPPAGAAQPGSDRCRCARNTRGEALDAEKASRPPQTDHRSLFRAEAEERKQERPSAPPS
ncbi:hypothetical protein NDU88_000779 [Pleurodeles waltl]|uniref:Uncharacterized protein n=1 Tax=Pleurodeles waltl TaxID=8319 RepID=A0AAV7VZH7_PLEWA|nr:hypothetical protein NDU88_000779 [Pleurodeles waltl]